MFDKMVAETRRTQGVVQGNSEVIQGINRITNKDQFFQGALRINKNLNEHKVKISIDKSGQALLNAEHAINPETFAASPATDKVAFLKNIGESKITARNVSVNLGMDVQPNCINPMYIKAVSFAISAAKLIDSFPEFSSSTEEILEAIARRLSGFTEKAYQYFVMIVEEIFNNITKTVWERLRALGVRDSEVVEKLIRYVLDELQRRARVDEKHIPDILKMFFVDGHIPYEKIQELFNGFQNVINSEYRKIGYREVKCKLCNGIRFSD